MVLAALTAAILTSLSLVSSAAAATLDLSKVHPGDVFVTSKDGIHVFRNAIVIAISTPATSAVVLQDDTRDQGPGLEASPNVFDGYQRQTAGQETRYNLDTTQLCPRSRVEQESSTNAVDLTFGDVVVGTPAGLVFKIESSGDRTLVVNVRNPADTRNADPRPSSSGVC